eukprot:10492366-Lingulodinium_polyedra.AAC.1
MAMSNGTRTCTKSKLWRMCVAQTEGWPSSLSSDTKGTHANTSFPIRRFVDWDLQPFAPVATRFPSTAQPLREI